MCQRGTAAFQQCEKKGETLHCPVSGSRVVPLPDECGACNVSSLSPGAATSFEALENQNSHETEGLGTKQLVVRRRKPFNVTLLFHSRPSNCFLSPHTGNLSERIPVQFSDQRSDPHSWSAKIYPGGVHPQSVSVHVCSPACSSVALYHLLVHIETNQGRRSYAVGDFVLLCNPWLKDDPVYMPLDAQIQEYIKSDYRLVYMGTYQNISRRPWSFGQVCDTWLSRMDHTKDYIRRADPVYLSRVICAMVRDDNSRCMCDRHVEKRGKWQGKGSADILHRWVSSNCSPVRYGQCWVFAAVLCTGTLNKYYSSTGEKLNLSKDSNWNFHVWVECWMRRADLGSGFDGWQVVDPDPPGDEWVFCCGPCPVVGVRRRYIRAPYDASFVYAAVDANVVRLILHEGRVVGRKLDAEWVGQLIYTKSIDSDAPENLTGAYKSKKKGFLEPRTHPSPSPPGGTPPGTEVSLSIDGRPSVGENISVRVTVTNQSSRPRLLMEHLDAQLKDFSCNPERSFWKAHKEVRIQPGEGEETGLRRHGRITVFDVVLAAQEFNMSSQQITIEVRQHPRSFLFFIAISPSPVSRTR
uniref:Transglutaminase-like domain-containing protein n=1 Tax=Cyclopterus lumpus TaxID=8103 RepID=A0A8C3G906_CYCLU